MDWIELLFLFFFFVLPLLQSWWKGRRDEPAPPEEETVIMDLPPEKERERDQKEPQEWSFDWGSWPEATTAEDLAGEEVLEEEEAEELARLQEEMPADETPEAVRVSTPVVSMESLEGDRRARPARPQRERLVAPGRVVHRSVPRLTKLLHGRDNLRRAILLSEVLGPPRGIDPGGPSLPGRR